MAKQKVKKGPKKKLGKHLKASDAYTPKNNLTGKMTGYRKTGFGK